MAQESESGVSSVVSVQSDVNWPDKLRDDNPLAQLHKKFWGKRMDLEEEEWRKSQLEPVDDDLEGDILPGCYVLDIGIKTLFSKMWIRADYKRIYDSLERYHSTVLLERSDKAPSAVLTGQSGIG
jgi:hypothetical protein